MPDDLNALVLQVSADVRSLQRQMTQAQRIVDASMTEAERRAQRGARQIAASFASLDLGAGAHAFGANLGERISELSREGSRALGPLGAALSAIGPAGIIAAAGVGAFAVAVEGAIRTAEWAERLGDLANQLHLTTTQLQALQFAATAAGLPVQQMDATLVSLTNALGAAQAGGRAGRQFRQIFAGLGISVEDLQGMRDVTQLLPRLADAIQHLNQVAPSEAAAIGNRLGIDPEVLHELEQGRGRLDDLTSAAARYGVIIDASVIERGARAADSMRLLRTVIDAELRQAFIQLSPDIDTSATALVRMIGHLNEFIAKANDATTSVWDLIRGLQNIPHDIAVRLQITARQNPGTGLPELLGVAGAGILRRDPLTRVTLDAFGAANRIRQQARVSGQATGDLIGNFGLGALDAAIEANPAGGGASSILDQPGRGRGGRGSRAGRGAASSRRPQEAHWIVEPGGPDGRGIWTLVGGDGHVILSNVDRGLNPISADAHGAGVVDLNRTISGNEIQTLDTGVRDLAGDLARALEADHEQIQAQWADIIQGGLEAGFRDGWGGIAKFIAESLERALIQSISGRIANLAAPNAVGGGGILGFLGSIFHFAGGTSSAPGGWSLVGERGPELMNVPAGAQIIPAGLSRAMAQMAAAGSGGDTNLRMTINLEGANGDETIRRIAYQASFEGTQRAVAIARKSTPGWVARAQTEGRG